MTAPSPTLPQTKPDAAQEILAMIEAVDPSDTAKLDEIDARVWCWRMNVEFVPHGCADTYNFQYREDGEVYSGSIYQSPVGMPTRSRDALKRMRPVGWWVDIDSLAHSVKCTAFLYRDGVYRARAVGVHLPTEELAELYTVINAIQHDREAA